MPTPIVTQECIDAYQHDGVTVIRGLLTEYVDLLRSGVEFNLAHPGPYAAENTHDKDTGRFFDDYCNWQRIPAFQEVIHTSPLAAAAAALMQSQKVQLFHEHVLIKEPGTSKATPWHQDAPYYFVDGRQNISFWCPLDPVDNASLRCVVGSHKWDKFVLPIRWLSEDNFYAQSDDYRPLCDPDAEGMEIREWTLTPGDVIAFHFSTLHGARGNTSQNRRRAFSLRLLGDDARYIERCGQTSPPFPGHAMQSGQILREDWFPYIYP